MNSSKKLKLANIAGVILMVLIGLFFIKIAFYGGDLQYWRLNGMNDVANQFILRHGAIGLFLIFLIGYFIHAKDKLEEKANMENFKHFLDVDDDY